MEADDPVNIFIAHIGKCHIVSLKERKSGVIILKIERFPHPRGHLVDKAENTLISAGAVFTHQAVFKGKAQILSSALDLKLPLLSVCLSDQHNEGLTVCHIIIIENIFNFLSVYGKQYITGL